METTKHYSLRFVAAILSIAIALMSLPLTVFADELGRLFENQETEVVAEKELFEVLEKRTATSKTFRLEDGSFYIAQYDSDIHYLDENGVWQEIDNTLTAYGSEISTKNAKIKFLKKTNGSNKIFTIQNGDQKLTLSLIGANKKVTGKVTNHQTEFDDKATKLEKMTTLDRVNASVLYEEILKDTDLEYVVSGVNIKENIIVKAKQERYCYSFELQLNNLTAELTEKGEVRISDSSQLVYLIPAPFMLDSAHQQSDQVSFELVSQGNGKYILTVNADPNWINADERVFPVTIDPPIYTSASSSVVDLDFPTTSPDHNSPNDTSIYVSDTWRAYWKLTTLPVLPASAYITEAKFTMACYTNSAMHGYVAAYDVLTDWQSDLTYAMTIAEENPKGVPATDFTDFQELQCYIVDEYGNYDLNNYWGYYWNITPIVKKWYAGQNYGVMFAPATGTTFTGTAQFRSNNYSNSAKRPQLCITYRDMKGLEDYWSYSSQGAGFSGAGSVNHATGNLVFTIPTLTGTDALMPFTPTLVYNSSMAGKGYQYPNAQVSYWGTDTAYGFKHNLRETLIKKSYTGQDGTQKNLFVWADGDGTEHYFLPTSTENTYSDEDGLLLTLAENTTDQKCTITDANKNIKTFNKLGSQPSGTVSGWYLSEITDPIGNKVVFGFESGPRPISVSLKPKNLPAIEQLRMAYDSNYKLYIVWNPTSNEAVIFRYSGTPSGAVSTSTGSYLRQVVRAHGTGTVTQAEWRAFYDSNTNQNTGKITVDAVAYYEYDASGRLTVARNGLTDYALSYEYGNGRVVKIREYSGVGPMAETGQMLGLTYLNSSTEIRTAGTDDTYGTADDLITTYGFDYEGRTVSCYTTDLNRTQMLGASNGQYVGEDNEKAKNNLKSSVQTTQQSSNYLLNGGFEKTATGSIPYWNKTGTASGGNGIEYEGQSCATLTVDTNTTTSSIYQYVYLDKGDYSLSMYINTHESQGVKVYLKAESMSNSAHSVVQEVPVNEYYATASYAFFALNFSSLPSTNNGKERFKISVVVSGAPTKEAEDIWVDNLMLSKTTGSAEYDMVSMGHFESSNGLPRNFWKILERNNDPITIVDSGIPAFGDVLKIDINVDEYEFVQQTVYEATDSLKSGYDAGEYYETDPMVFTISGWGKGTAQAYAGTSLFGIRVEIYYHNGSQYGTSEYYDFDFDKGITDWQFISGCFTTNPNKGMVSKIVVMLMYNNHPGIGYFDNISLVQDSNTSDFYNYNMKGYLTSYKSGRKNTWYQYDANNNVTAVVSSDKTYITYEYNSDNQLKKETHSKYTGLFRPSDGTIVNGTRTNIYYHSYGYNSYGQHYYTWTYNCANTQEQTAQFTEYNTGRGSHIFGTVNLEMDSLGNITRYFYNENNGRLRAVLYPEGNGVCYSYDGIGNLTQVMPADIVTTDIYHEEYDQFGEDHSWTETIYDYEADEFSASVSYGYNSVTNRLDTISTESTTYTFIYDAFGNTEQISVGDHVLADYQYNSGNGKLNTLSYGNGLQVKYVYDILDRISEIQYNIGENNAFETVYSYTYDTAGNIYSISDHVNHEISLYKYDAEGKLVNSYLYDSETYLNQYGSHIYYDDQSRISMVFHYIDYSCPAAGYHGTTYSDSSYYSYWYDATTGNLSQLTISGDYLRGTIKPTYDNFGRTDHKEIDFNVNNSNAFYNYLNYAYKNDGTRNESGLIAQLISEIRMNSDTSLISTTTYNYTYDDNGNITQIADAGGVIQNKYYYDSLGQLIREDNRALGNSYTYTYDNAGNRTLKKRFNFTLGTLGNATGVYEYSYSSSGWGDMLIYDDSTYSAISYDTIGNPTYIENTDDPEIYSELAWRGRLLMSFSEYDIDSCNSVSFTYNNNGIRTSKTVDGIRHDYVLNGSQIISEIWKSGNTEHLLYYVYDENGLPIGLQYRTSAYEAGVFDCFFFEKNLQGDIIAVYNSTGKRIGSYTYDAWGNFNYSLASGNTALETRIVYRLNPFRYRGYYYDVETGLYYLQSRYYNPKWGRFLNADDSLYSSIFGFNLFAYCDNNPISYIDPYGESGFAAALAGWASSAWGLTLVDGPLPVGDIIYVAGCAVLGALAIVETIMLVETVVDLVQEATDTTPDSAERPTDENGNPVVKPGEQPTADDGYVPPKKGPRWNKEKKGWEDSAGNVWVPAPTGSKSGHGGGHWDVQSPGGGYTNVYPGGKVRGGKAPLPKLSIIYPH